MRLKELKAPPLLSPPVEAEDEWYKPSPEDAGRIRDYVRKGFDGSRHEAVLGYALLRSYGLIEEYPRERLDKMTYVGTRYEKGFNGDRIRLHAHYSSAVAGAPLPLEPADLEAFGKVLDEEMQPDSKSANLLLYDYPMAKEMGFAPPMPSHAKEAVKTQLKTYRKHGSAFDVAACHLALRAAGTAEEITASDVEVMRDDLNVGRQEDSLIITLHFYGLLFMKPEGEKYPAMPPLKRYKR